MSRPNPESFMLSDDHPLVRFQHIALITGIIALALCAVGALAGPQQFFRSYLVAYLFWFGIAMGGLIILMIYHITGGAWGAVIRRPLEAATRTFPLLALMFVPIALGVGSLYEWANPELVAHDALLQHKSPYLNVPFFLGRAVFYFIVWNVIARALNYWSIEQERRSDEQPIDRLEMLSRGGLVATGLTITFASIDWAMSLEPHWSSTLYGVLIVGGQILAGVAFMIEIATLLIRSGPLGNVIGKDQFHDLGKLLLAYTMLWGYFSLSQFLIIWSANLPEEIPWYLKRMHGGWEYVGILIVLFHFGLPFVLLLSRDLKRNARMLSIVAAGVLVMRFVDLYWMITPSFHPNELSVHWMDLAALIGVGGVWFWAFVGQLRQRTLIVLNDPSLPEIH